ncbi:MAG: EAL domain-containing protein [Spirochaetes bacterium]|jgi:diguanylate cyclase (GGDEF)-like protein/PAS domain S-box-containing protein|nr:EAL domain-containing protein [Spirochaetota bacterium]
MYDVNQIEIVFNLVFPAVSAVISFLLGMMFLYFYRRCGSLYYRSSLLLSLNIVIYSLSEAFLRFEGILFDSYQNAFIFYGIKQVSIGLLIVTVSYLFITLEDTSRNQKRFFIGMMIAGSFMVMTSSYALLVDHQLFLKRPVIVSEDSISYTNIYRIYQYGLLYHIRNIIVMVLTIFAFSLFLSRLILHKNYYENGVQFAGVFVLTIFSILDVIRLYCGNYFGLFPNISFPRTSIGLLLFLLIYSFYLIQTFFEKAGLTDKTLDDLRESEKNLKLIARNVNEVVWITDYPPSITYYINSLFKQIFNIPVKDVYRDCNIWKNAVHLDDRHYFEDVLNLDKISQNSECEYRIYNRTNVAWVRDRIYPVRNKNGEIFRIIRIIEDITDRKQSEEQLSYLAFHDPLTGMPNRKALYETMSDSLLQSARNRFISMKAFLFIDLDEFKDVNETAGHSVGDKLLCFVSDRLQNTIRETDYLYRIGGDEFVVILNNIEDEFAAASVSEKIIEKLAKPFICDTERLFIGVSIGISIYPKDGIDIEDLIKNSDIALRDAKKVKNSFSFYNTEMNIKAINRVLLEKDLRGALERGEFNLVYQPFIDQKGEVCGMEVLLRWNSIHGPIPPDKFIPIIENNGLIVPIGRWVLQQALIFQKSLADMGYKIRIAINISPRQFRDEQFLSIVEKAFEKSGAAPDRVELEITEGLMVEDPLEIAGKMKLLNKSGVRFSIDDFGTGYSSLSYIKDFPISHIKIDRSFVINLDKNESNRKIIRAIVAMAHSLGLAVIGEGIETEEQLAFLGSIGCDEIQGYYYSRPLSPEEFISYVKSSDTPKRKS